MNKQNSFNYIWPTLFGSFFNPEHKKIKEQLDNDLKVMKSFELIDKFFKPFGKPEQLQGNIRNFVFNTEYLKSHFEGINSVEEGISSLWSDVSTKYGGFFKFGYHQDENNNGRIAVVDFNYQNDLEKNPTKLLDESFFFLDSILNISQSQFSSLSTLLNQLPYGQTFTFSAPDSKLSNLSNVSRLNHLKVQFRRNFWHLKSYVKLIQSLA